jgi:hypothetical protein
MGSEGSMIKVEELIESFATFSEASIGKLQTTFFELECIEPAAEAARKFKVHYVNKHEFKLQVREINSLRLEVDHPLLLQYHQPICSLQLVSEVKDKACFLDKLDAATNEIFHGWRQAVDYCFMPPERFIEKSFGILLDAPTLYVEAVAENAEASGVKLVPGKPRKPVAPSAKALLMDDMYVIADDFRLEEMIR